MEFVQPPPIKLQLRKNACIGLYVNRYTTSVVNCLIFNDQKLKKFSLVTLNSDIFTKKKNNTSLTKK